MPITVVGDAPIREPRTKFIDPDYRKDPKTNLYCARCQRDIKGNYRHVLLTNGGEPFALHPDDRDIYQGTVKKFPIGPECVRVIGREWTTS